VTFRSRKPGHSSAETEADGEDRLDRAALRRAEVLDGGSDVGLDALRCRLLGVLAVTEVVAALPDARRAAEVVDRDGGDAALSEAERQFLLEPVQAADVRQDDNAGAGRPVGHGGERREPRPVAGLELELAVLDGGTHDDRDRRQGVALEAHRRSDDTFGRSGNR
jgi:hypothetical protein